MASGLRNTSGKATVKRPRPDAGTTPPSPEAGFLPTIRTLLAQQLEKIEEQIHNLEVSLKGPITKLETAVTEIHESLSFQNKETDDLKKQVKKLEETVKEKENALQGEVDKLSLYVARENLLFIGLPETEGEDVNKVLSEFYINNLKMSHEEVQNIEYQRAHRTAGKNPRPMKARFVRYRDRDIIMKNAYQLKGTKLFVKEDIPKRMRELRKKQIPALVAARKAGKSAFFSKSEPTKLYVNRIWLPVEQQKSFLASLEGSDRDQAGGASGGASGGAAMQLARPYKTETRIVSGSNEHQR